jgi:hypothetical protein
MLAVMLGAIYTLVESTPRAVDGEIRCSGRKWMECKRLREFSGMGAIR